MESRNETQQLNAGAVPDAPRWGVAVLTFGPAKGALGEPRETADSDRGTIERGYAYCLLTIFSGDMGILACHRSTGQAGTAGS